MKKYRVFITIEEEETENDNFEQVYDECLGIFDTLKEAHELYTAIQETYLS